MIFPTYTIQLPEWVNNCIPESKSYATVKERMELALEFAARAALLRVAAHEARAALVEEGRRREFPQRGRRQEQKIGEREEACGARALSAGVRPARRRERDRRRRGGARRWPATPARGAPPPARARGRARRRATTFPRL